MTEKKQSVFSPVSHDRFGERVKVRIKLQPFVRLKCLQGLVNLLLKVSTAFKLFIDFLRRQEGFDLVDEIHKNARSVIATQTGLNAIWIPDKMPKFE